MNLALDSDSQLSPLLSEVDVYFCFAVSDRICLILTAPSSLCESQKFIADVCVVISTAVITAEARWIACMP